MKIKKMARNPFTPVAVEIETEKELWTLYHKFNCGSGQSFDHYCEDGQCDLSEVDIDNVAQKIFKYMEQEGYIDEN
jgi:hypothetical protein